jgi:hypothetical protein
VPRESGVHFQIASRIRDEGLCLVFHVDQGADAVVDGVRPDYLVLYCDARRCLCTIVELKGTERKNLEHGIEQIVTFHGQLRAQVREHLPRKCRIDYQGLLLTPFNAQVPLRKLKAIEKTIRIVPLQYDHKAELYPYVRAPADPAARYEHQPLRRDPPELNALERLIRTLDARLPPCASGRDVQGLRLGCAPEAAGGHGFLVAGPAGAELHLDPAGAANAVAVEVRRLGLEWCWPVMARACAASVASG